MAEVWVARLLGKHGFEKLFAIKTIRPDFAADVSFQNMFLDEARIASNLVHPNIAQVIDLGEQNGVLYIVMDWVVGESFQRMLGELHTRHHEMPVSITLRVLREIAAGLHYAHELTDKDGNPLGIVHRDISPQNILITSSGHAKLIDFGVAKAKDRLGGETGQGIMKGKLDYMSPEQAAGEPVDHRADVWSLGAVLYRCLAGMTPYRSDSQVTTLKRLVSGDAVMPLPATVPHAVAEICHRALQFRREDRYESAQAMREAIEHAIAVSRLKISSVEVATFMKDLMAQRMELTREAIKASIRAVTGHSGSGSLIDQLHESTPSSSTPVSHPGATSLPDLHAATPAPRAPPSQPSHPPAPTSSAPTVANDRPFAAAPASTPEPEAPAPPQKSRAVLIVALVAAVVSALVGGFFLSSRPSSARGHPSEPAPLPAAVPPVAVQHAEPPPAVAPPPERPAEVEPAPVAEPPREAAPSAPADDAVKSAANRKAPAKPARPATPPATPPPPASNPNRVDLGY